MSNAAKNFDSSSAFIRAFSLCVLHNYFDDVIDLKIIAK